MSSKIGAVAGTPAAPADAGRVAPRARDAGSGAQITAPGGSEDVQITSAARQRATLEQALRDLPAVSDTRVAQVRSAIEQGTYVIRPEQIADRLIQIEQALGQLPDPAGGDASSHADQTG